MPYWNRPALISLSAALLLPGAAGWWLGRSGPAQAEDSSRTGIADNRGVQELQRRLPGGHAGLSWMKKVRAAPGEELEALYEAAAQEFPDEVQRKAAQRWLLALWVSRDARGAVAFANPRQLEVGPGVMGQLLGTLAPDAVVELLTGDAALPFEMMNACYAMARKHPRRFLELEGKAGSEWSAALPDAIAALARERPQDAVTAWAGLPPGDDAARAARELTETWFQQDAAAARRWIEALPEGKARHIASHAWLNALAATDSRAALHELGSMVDSPFSSPVVEGEVWGHDRPPVQDCRLRILENLAKESPRESLSLLAGLLQENTDDEYRESLESAFIHGSREQLPVKPNELIPVLRNLLNDAGLPAVSSAGESSEGLMEQALIAVHFKWDAADLLNAAKLLTTQQGVAPDVSTATLGMFIRTAAEKDQAAAVAMFAGLPESAREPLRTELLSVLSGESLATAVRAVPETQWSAADGHTFGQDPGKNAGLVASLPETPAAGSARRQFAEEWAVRDPEAAVSWVQSLPASPGAQESARGITQGWATYDDVAASIWAATLPPGPAHDGAAAGLVVALAKRDPESAQEWAQSIGAETVRAEALLLLEAEASRSRKGGTP